MSAALVTRSERLTAALRARGGVCALDDLREDLRLRGFPDREFWPALTLAVLGGQIHRVDEHTVGVVVA
jgi:hypothetical protein